MYREYKNGTPISEIVKKTGINRKAWNQRFSRLEKQIMVAKSNSEINNAGKNANVTRTNTKKPINKFAAAIYALAILVAVFFIYLEIKKSRENLDQ